MNANTNAKSTKSAKSYNFMNDSSKLASATETGVSFYFAAALPLFVGCYDGTDYAIKSADYVTKTRKDGRRILQVKIVPANLKSNGIYVTTSTTAAIDLRKVGANYEKQFNRLVAKNAAANTPDAIAKREVAEKTRKLRAQARAYLRNLLKHGMDEQRAQDAADDFLLEQYKQYFANNTAA